MKRNRLTIAVLSACMLAATGGISLGAAALANAPEAANGPESSLVAGQVISEGIKVIKKASYSNDTLSFTYAVTPDYAVTNVTAALSWNASGVSDQIGTFLEITSHNASTKTVTVHKKQSFGHQAKLVLTDSLSNSTATVLIDCTALVDDLQNQGLSYGSGSVFQTFSLCNNHNNLDWVNLDQMISAAIEIRGPYTIDPEVTIFDVSISEGRIYSDTTSTWNATNAQNYGAALSDQNQVVSTYATEGQDSENLEDFGVSYGAIEISDSWLQHEAGDADCRYIHFEITFEVCVSWNEVAASHTEMSSGNGGGTYYPTYRWCYDRAELTQASAVTPEVGQIYF